MQKSERIQARIEPELKQAAEAIFATLGLSSTEAVRLFYRQVELHGGLIEVRIPNRETLQAINEADARQHLKSYASFDDLMADIEK